LEEVVLILSTDATRTGTPLLLLNTLKFFKSNSNNKYILVLQRGGELIKEFRELCDVYIWPDSFSLALKIPSRNFFYRNVKEILLFCRKVMSFLFILKIKFKYSVRLIYCNSARNGDILRSVKSSFNVKVLLYVHEAERTLDLFNRTGSVDYCISGSEKIVTVSESVKQMLIRKYHATQKIVVIPGGIETNFKYISEHRALLRAEGISDNKFIIMCCGWLDWHKGIDVFILIAKILTEQNKFLHFVWLGGNEKDPGYKMMQFDIEKLRLKDRITIITSKKEAIPYIGCSDIFLLLSREESFSLVTLEAGLAKKPVLCFDDTGGPLEILDRDTRFTIPYLDISKMIERIKDLVNDESQRNEMGLYLYKRVIDNYSLLKNASLLQHEISQLLMV